MDAANTAGKLFTRYGSKPGSQPDLDALQRNMAEYENHYAMAMNFLIRGYARQAVSSKLFLAALTPEQRTPVRERGFAQARSSAVEFILAAICSAIQGSSKPENARLVAAALHDTREVWASYFAAAGSSPRDRADRRILPSKCRMKRREANSLRSRPRFAP